MKNTLLITLLFLIALCVPISAQWASPTVNSGKTNIGTGFNTVSVAAGKVFIADRTDADGYIPIGDIDDVPTS